MRHTDADGSFEGWNVTADGATFVNQPIGSMTGFPNNNTPNDKATYDISIDIPNTITNTAGTGNAAAASNGELISKDVGASRTTWNWEQEEPMASELVIISIGKYDVLRVRRHAGQRPHAARVELRRLGQHHHQQEQHQRPARPLQERAGRARVASTAPTRATASASWSTSCPSAINYALETQDRSFFPTSIGADTFVHEAAHQWYGNNVAPTVWNDLYINEGMATWAPVHYNSVVAEPPTTGTGTEYTYFTSWSSSAPRELELDRPRRPASPTPLDLYGYQTYTRSAQFWEALRLSIGDAAFFDLIEEWQVRYAGESHGTADSPGAGRGGLRPRPGGVLPGLDLRRRQAGLAAALRLQPVRRGVVLAAGAGRDGHLHA